MRKHNFIKLTCTLVLALLLLTACGDNGGEATPTVDTESVIATSIAATMQVMAETQAAQVTATPVTTAATVSLPTATVAAASLPTATIQSVSLPANCLIAGLASETIPDETIIAKGATFTKKWVITNGGTCTWSTSYKMVFESGDLLGAESEEVYLTENVGPGMLTTVSIKMTAPNTDGWYTGYWTLLTDAGVLVGRFSVNIYVGTPTAAPFSVKSVSYPSGSISVTCDDSTVTKIPIYITTDGAGNVTYYITSNHGSAAAGDLTFSSATTQTINYSMVFPTTDTEHDVDINITINNPNNQTWYLRHLDAICK